MADMKHRTGPKMQVPQEPEPEAPQPDKEPAAPVEEPPEPAPAEPGEEPTEDMATAPKGGQVVWLRSPLNTWCEAKWHRTRVFIQAPEGARWEETGWWRIPLNGQKVPFEPVGWRKVA